MQVFFASAPAPRGARPGAASEASALLQVEIDRCFFCGGMWFDAGELENVAGRPSRLRREASQSPRRCAGCDTQLGGARWGNTSVDGCPSCGGFYLDEGELQQLAGRTVPLEGKSTAPARPPVDPDLSFRCPGCAQRFPYSEGLTTASGLACNGCYPYVDNAGNTVVTTEWVRRGPAPWERDYVGEVAGDVLGNLLSRAARLVLDIDN